MNVLFLCKSNVFRSQMAEGFFNHFFKMCKAESAALMQPHEKMHRLIVKAMKEEGIDIKNNKSKKVSKEMLNKADILIFMSEDLERYLADLSKNLKKNIKIEIWKIPDIIAKETDTHLYKNFIKARETIKNNVLNLIDRINKEKI